MDLGKVRQALLDCGQAFDSAELFPTVIPEPAPLVVSDPYAFAIATCLDRGTKADIIWTIPYDIKNLLGHLNPNDIYRMSLEDLSDLFAPLHPDGAGGLRFVGDYVVSFGLLAMIVSLNFGMTLLRGHAIQLS
jgi:hypothetical protein